MVLGKIRSPGLAAFAIIRSPSFSISAAGTGNLRPLFCHRLPLSLKPRWGWEHPHDIDIIEQIAILRIRHFRLAATRVQEIPHPQFFIVIRRLEKCAVTTFVYRDLSSWVANCRTSIGMFTDAAEIRPAMA